MAGANTLSGIDRAAPPSDSETIPASNIINMRQENGKWTPTLPKEALKTISLPSGFTNAVPFLFFHKTSNCMVTCVFEGS